MTPTPQLGSMPTQEPNPVTSISNGYAQLEKIVRDVIALAEQTPWYVWAAIAGLLLFKSNDRGRQ